MIIRDLEQQVRRAAASFPVVTLTGPRQSGKSTLCRMLFPDHAYVNLESPDIRRMATDDPRGFLDRYPHGAILDEIQRCPEIPSYLQEMVDSDSTPGRWILTGSQNLALLESVSQSLAGRTGVLHLLPLAYNEVQRFDTFPRQLEEAIVAGSYPRVFDRHIAPAEWFASYVATYIERDVRTISKVTDLLVFQRFMELCAGRTGQLLNASSLAADTGISQPTAKAWIGVLETSFLMFRLPPFLSNLRKRLVKMPKLYFYDAGLVCWLLNIRSGEQLRDHPLRGAIFETWVVSEIVKHRTNKGLRGGVFFYRDRNGFEVDLIVEAGDKLLAVEAKSGRTVSPDMARNAARFGSALDGSRATEAYVIYAGENAYESKGTSFLPWKMIAQRPWQ